MTALPRLNDDEIARYARHIMIDEVGMQGQRKLKAASVLVVGVGGLGSPISLYLAAAGVGRIGLVDHDAVEVSNLQRQVIHASSTLGMPKVESARRRLLDLNPHVQVDVYPEQFSPANALQVAREYELILDGTDNYAARFLLNDLCVLTGKPYIYGAVFRFEGQVSVFDARRGPCYRCLFPRPPEPGTTIPTAQAGLFGVLPGTIGTIQATEALKLILGIGDPLIGKLLIYNALDLECEMIDIQKNPACSVCSPHTKITSLPEDYE